MPSFEQDFSKSFVSAFPQAFGDASSQWLKLQQLRQQIENDNFQKDSYLQRRREEQDTTRREAGRQKRLLEMQKSSLLSSFGERPLPTGDPNQDIANLDLHEEMLRKRIADAKDHDELSILAPEVQTRAKTKAEKKQLESSTKILEKQLEINTKMPEEEKQKVRVFLDGTPDGLKAAQHQFSSWKEPDKGNKKTLAEEKAELNEDIWALAGDEDFNTGFERLKAADKEKFIRAQALGIKPIKGEEPVDVAKPYIDQIQRDFSVAANKNEAGDLKQFAIDWMEARSAFIPEEVKNKILVKLYPERTSLQTPIETQPAPAPITPPAEPSPVPQPNPLEQKMGMPLPTPTPTPDTATTAQVGSTATQAPLAAPMSQPSAPVAPQAPDTSNQQVPEAQAAAALSELKALQEELQRIEALFKK